MTDGAAIPGALECRELVELVTAYLEGTLPPAERLRFELHVAICAGCAAYLRQLRGTLAAAGSFGEDAPPEVRDGLLAAFREWTRRG